jgi:hypothetical protein
VVHRVGVGRVFCVKGRYVFEGGEIHQIMCLAVSVVFLELCVLDEYLLPLFGFRGRLCTNIKGGDLHRFVYDNVVLSYFSEYLFLSSFVL